MLLKSTVFTSKEGVDDDSGDNLDNPELMHDITLKDKQTIDAAIPVNVFHTPRILLWETI